MRAGWVLLITLLCLTAMAASPVQAEIVDYNLTITEQAVTYSGRLAKAVTVNGSIPGPVLRFQEGDWARIRVHNMLNATTSIHWHGVLVPPSMDGVPYISFPPISPGAAFTYEFPIRQAGTYWYHSHSELQEQRGLYGAIVIEPSLSRSHGHVHADHDHAVVLSDWTDEDPHAVLRELKRGSGWYAIEKGSAHSLLGAARLGMLGDYFASMLNRMPPMDISDVAYNRFLANGQMETAIEAKPGETVRVRIVNGSATTYFHIEYAGGPMTVISADGQDVEHFELKRLLIGVAETYDILVRIPGEGSYELRATAHDGSAFTSIWIGSGMRYPAPSIPRPNIYTAMSPPGLARIFAVTPAGAMGMADRDVEAGKFDRPGAMHIHHGKTATMQGTHTMDHGGAEQDSSEKAHDHNHTPDGRGSAGEPHVQANHHGMQAVPIDESLRHGRRFATNFGLFAADASSSSLAPEGGEERPWAPYEKLRSPMNTTFRPRGSVREIRLTLDGDMERYVWFLNNKPLSETDHILIHRGEIVRFIMINRTMMHHPMHLHGHFFRVLNGQGDRAPLKHTVDVPPMSTTVIEFDANEFGDWFFHCHLLYHMHSGMARLVHYDGYTPDAATAALRRRLYEESWYFHGEAKLLSNMTEGSLTLSNARNIVRAEWEAGWQGVDETEWEGILTWDRYRNSFLSFFAGAYVDGAEGTVENVHGIAGFRYNLPLDIDFSIWVDTDAAVRIALDKHLELTPRVRLFSHVEYDTHDSWEGRVGLAYVLNRYVTLAGQWHSQFGWGGGVAFRF